MSLQNEDIRTIFEKGAAVRRARRWDVPQLVRHHVALTAQFRPRHRLGVEFAVETRGADHAAELLATLQRKGYDIVITG